MQSGTPKGEVGQRPLQKSMFLPDFQPQPMLAGRPQPMENIHYNPMKRSSMPVLESANQANLSPTYHPHNLSYTHSFPQPPTFQFEVRAQSQHELLLPQGTPNVTSMKSLNLLRQEPPNELEYRSFTKLDKSAGLELKAPAVGAGEVTDGQQQQLLSAVVEELREKHLPVLMRGLKKEVSDELGLLRAQLSGLRVELKAHLERQECFNNEIRSQTGNIINFNTNNINNISKPKKDEPELERQLALLERKHAQIEVKLSENLTSLYNEFEKITLRLEKDSKERAYKVGLVRSSLPPIMLEYRESFTVRRSELAPRATGEEEILIGSCCYYIDRSGYLLDADGKYLTDLRGLQIRLEERHLKLLEQYKLLHR